MAVTLVSIGIMVATQGAHPAMLAFDILVMLPVLGAALWTSKEVTSHRLYQFLLAASAMLIGMWITSVVTRASIEGMPYYFAALVAWVFVVWLILGLPFRHAAVTTLTISGLYVSGSFLWIISFNEAAFTTTLLILVNGIGAFCCYQLEHSERRSFLDAKVLSQLAERNSSSTKS